MDGFRRLWSLRVNPHRRTLGRNIQDAVTVALDPLIAARLSLGLRCRILLLFVKRYTSI